MPEMESLVEALETETQMPAADTAFTKGPELPFVIILDKVEGDGDDFHTRLLEHNLTVEFYAERVDKKSEGKLESFFENRSWKYSRERIWLPDEKCFETIYEIAYSERV